jgi:hypothetical protein
MRTIHPAETQPCYECRGRSDVVVARGHRIWYSCWEHASALLEAGGVIVGGELASRRSSRAE